MIFNVDGKSRSDFKRSWVPSLEPIGFDTSNKESFEAWWGRCGEMVNGLHQMIAEQWIFRHWDKSPYCDLPIHRLSWRLESWTAQDLSKIFLRPQFGPLAPEEDFVEFSNGTSEPWKSLNEIGTWNYPIIVLETPEGVIAEGKHLPDVRFCLIEGHQRYRFLKAWQGRAHTAAEHSVFVLTLEE
jgi:hypothetical protein